MYKSKQKEKGITLIALIITIVILAILLTVTITLAGDERIFDTAEGMTNLMEETVNSHQDMIDEVKNSYIE